MVKPTEVTLAPGSPATLVKVEYPVGKLMSSPGGAAEKVDVYEGKATIKVRLRLDEKADAIDFVVKYQPCNDKACLAPARLKVTMKTGAQ